MRATDSCCCTLTTTANTPTTAKHTHAHSIVQHDNAIPMLVPRKHSVANEPRFRPLRWIDVHGVEVGHSEH